MKIPQQSNQNVKPPVRHLDWLDQVRGVAALYVVIHHAVINIALPDQQFHDPLYKVMQILSGKGHYAVDVFIVLSGYCLMLPLVRKEFFGNVALFYLRRTVRIVFPYYVAMLLSLVLIYSLIGFDTGTHWASSLPVTSGSIVKHLLLIQQWFPLDASKINHVFWSIGVEYQIYFLFPFFFYLTKHFSLTMSWGVIALLGYAFWLASIVLSKPDAPPAGESFIYCGLFYLGMMAAKFSFTEQRELPTYLAAVSKLPRLSVAIIICVVGLIALIGNQYREAMPLLLQSLFVGVATALLFFLKGTQRIGFIRNKRIANILNWLGMIGFSLYLIHAPILELVWLYIVQPMELLSLGLQSIAMVVFGTAISILCGWVFYSAIESPCHRLSKSIKNIPAYVGEMK